jgi:hypothetical protein
VFFFEKKNQKTFVYEGVTDAPARTLNEQEFLLLFSKRSAFFPCLLPTRGVGVSLRA